MHVRLTTLSLKVYDLISVHRDADQGEILYVSLLDFLMNELMASEKLGELFAFDSTCGDAALSMIAFSLAVKNGFSLGVAEMCVVTPV